MPRTRLDRKKNDALGVLLNGYVYKDGGNLATGAEKNRPVPRHIMPQARFTGRFHNQRAAEFLPPIPRSH